MGQWPPHLLIFFRHSKGLWLFRCVFKSKINIQFTLFQNFCCTMVDEQNSKDDDWCSQYLFQNFSTCCTMVEDGFCPLLSNDRVSCGASPKKQSLETILLQQNFWGNYKLYIVSICNFGFLLNSKLQNICRRKKRQDNAHLSLPSPSFFSTRCTRTLLKLSLWRRSRW